MEDTKHEATSKTAQEETSSDLLGGEEIECPTNSSKESKTLSPDKDDHSGSEKTDLKASDSVKFSKGDGTEEAEETRSETREGGQSDVDAESVINSKLLCPEESTAVKESCLSSGKADEDDPKSIKEERCTDLQTPECSHSEITKPLERDEREAALSKDPVEERKEEELEDSSVPDFKSDTEESVKVDDCKSAEVLKDVDNLTSEEEMVAKIDVSSNKSDKDESKEDGSHTVETQDCTGSAVELSDTTQSSKIEEDANASSKVIEEKASVSPDNEEGSASALNIGDDSDQQRDSCNEEPPESTGDIASNKSKEDLDEGSEKNIVSASNCNSSDGISDPVMNKSDAKTDEIEAMDAESENNSSENASVGLLLNNAASETTNLSANKHMDLGSLEPPASVEKCTQDGQDTSSIEVSLASESVPTVGTGSVAERDEESDEMRNESPASDRNTLDLNEQLHVEKSQINEPSNTPMDCDADENNLVVPSVENSKEMESKGSNDTPTSPREEEISNAENMSEIVCNQEEVNENRSQLQTPISTENDSLMESNSEVEVAGTSSTCEENQESADTESGKDMNALTRADVDNVCEEESMDSTDHNDESDPFCSLNEKGKETESQLDHEESQKDETEKEASDKIKNSGKEQCVLEKDDKDKSRKHQEGKEAHSKSPSDAGEGEATTCSTEGGNEVEEDLCIVPDTEPRIPTDKEKAEAVEKASKATLDTVESSVEIVQEKTSTPSSTSEKASSDDKRSSPSSVESKTATPTTPKSKSSNEGDAPSPVLTPSRRPQRQAAQRADAQIKVCLAAVANRKDDDAEDEDDGDKTCAQCGTVSKCKYQVKAGNNTHHLCKEDCYNEYKKKNSVAGSTSPTTVTVGKAQELDRPFVRKCGECELAINISDEKVLTWETMDFCHEECLGKYQTELGSHCANCKGAVQSQSLGKYCVRFGYDIKQFCCASCLEEFKKGLKVCSYCQKDISSGVEGFLAPVGDKGQFKDFCAQPCMEKYDQMSNNTAPPQITHECAVCNNEKVVKVEVVVDTKVQKLCSEPCFAAFKFVNQIDADQCDMCKKYFDKAKTDNFTVFYDDAPHSFCCKTCMNVYILAKRKIVPCSWCKVKKYNFDMIKKSSPNGQALMMCSLNCLSLYQVSVNAVSSRRIQCDMCGANSQAQYHLTMSDATIRNFCCYSCVMKFQGKYSKSPITLPGSEQAPHPTGGPKKTIPRRSVPVGEKEMGSKNTSMPVISSVTSLAPANGQPPSSANAGTPALTSTGAKQTTPNETVRQVYKQQLIIKPPLPPERQNRAVQVKPIMHTKGVSCRPHPCTKETQTEENAGKPLLIPIPVPIFIPVPMHMYTSPYPVPVPFPLPIPVPIFIPTTRNSAKGIFKEIKRIQEKIPTDPFEAELLMMAEMVAGEKKAENTDTESEDGDTVADDPVPVASAEEPVFTPEAVDTSNTFGDDMLQMALKMASELDEPAVDFEAAVAPATISQSTPASQIDHNEVESEADDADSDGRNRSGRKRSIRTAARPPSVAPKRGRRISGSDSMNILPATEPVTARVEPTEKPDAKMCLKFTFGVNAWRHWVSQKNAELEKVTSNARKMKLFKPEILQLTADELNYSLCLFVKEVRKPNGSEYAPDTIYYLCLGIQQYLIENGRVENIFCDPYYEKFTDCLDEVAKKFSVLYNDAQYVVTRVEEEHLWESKQLGAHSPHVLLSTLMFFNTKHFNLTTVDEHMQLSFSHIMKHWKRNPTSPGAPKLPGSRNVLLRFYPPQSALAANSRKKKVYEQQENEDNPLRCPVKLYEFYLLKCPESVKTRNDVFYLLPERSCVPDSPVWYSTMALGKEQLQRMLHRIKMVKEINIALLGS